MKQISIKFSDFIDGYYLRKGCCQKGVFTDICNELYEPYYRKADKLIIEKGLRKFLDYNIIDNGDEIHNAINESLRTDSDSNTIEIYENKVEKDDLIQVILKLNNVDVDKSLEPYIREIVEDTNNPDDFGWLGGWITDNADNFGIIDTDTVRLIGTDLKAASIYLSHKVFQDIAEMKRTVSRLNISEEYKDLLSSRIQRYLMRFYVCNMVVRPKCDNKIDITITWSLHVQLDHNINIEF